MVHWLKEAAAKLALRVTPVAMVESTANWQIVPILVDQLRLHLRLLYQLRPLEVIALLPLRHVNLVQIAAVAHVTRTGVLRHVPKKKCKLCLSNISLFCMIQKI